MMNGNSDTGSRFSAEEEQPYNGFEHASLDVVLQGLSVIGDDHTMTVTKPIFDGLYEHYRRATLLGRESA